MITGLTPNERRLYFSLLACFTLMGAVVTLFGSVVVEVIRTYKWNYMSTGIVLSASAFGFFASSLVAGLLVRSLGTKRVMLIGLVVLAIALMMFGRTGNVAMNVILNFMIGIGLGTNESITNYLVAAMESTGRSRLMNLIHSSWCVGAFVGPFGIAALLARGVGWNIVFPGASLFVAAMTLFITTRRFSATVQTPTEAIPRARERGVLSSRRLFPRGTANTAEGERLFASVNARLVALCSLAIFVYVGVEKGMYGWISEYFVMGQNALPSLGAAMVGVYWFGQFAGRFLLSLLYKGNQHQRVILVLSAVSTAGIFALLVVGGVGPAAICTCTVGLANSGIFPMVVSLSSRFATSSRSIGLVTSSGGLGGFSFPYLIASAADARGIAAGFVVILCISAILTILSVVLAMRIHRWSRQSCPRESPSFIGPG